MAKTEELIAELIALKHKEMKRTRLNRSVKFIFGTLPVFILVVFSIYGTWVFAQKGSDLIDELPTLVQETVEGNIDEQLKNFR